MEQVVGGAAFLQALEYNNLGKPDFEIVMTEAVYKFIKDEPAINEVKFKKDSQPKLSRFYEISGMQRIPF